MPFDLILCPDKVWCALYKFETLREEGSYDSHIKVENEGKEWAKCQDVTPKDERRGESENVVSSMS